ncbi:MAG: hypothetical protein ACO34E_09090 [Limisphaerales bacterium]
MKRARMSPAFDVVIPLDTCISGTGFVPNVQPRLQMNSNSGLKSSCFLSSRSTATESDFAGDGVDYPDHLWWVRGLELVSSNTGFLFRAGAGLVGVVAWCARYDARSQGNAYAEELVAIHALVRVLA